MGLAGRATFATIEDEPDFEVADLSGRVRRLAPSVLNGHICFAILRFLVGQRPQDEFVSVEKIFFFFFLYVNKMTQS